MFTFESYLCQLQINVQQILDTGSPPLGKYEHCCSLFPYIGLRANTIIKNKARQLYIKTMIRIYHEPKKIKLIMAYIFGFSFYKSPVRFFTTK